MGRRAAVLLLLIFLAGCSGPSAPAGPPLRVAVVPATAGRYLFERIQLDPGLRLVELEEAQVVWVLEGVLTPEDDARAARARGRGAGVVRLAGGGGPASPADLVPGSAERGVDIAWTSAPKVRSRRAIPAEGQVLAGLVETPGQPARPIITVLDTGRQSGPLLRVGLALLAEDNAALRRWGYSNYLICSLSALAGGRTPPRFADWAPSPVPHRAEQLGWVALMVLLWPVSLLLFWLARRAARRQGDGLHEAFFAALNRAGTAGTDGDEQGARWARAGFERPMGGYLVLVCALVVFLAPYVAVVQYVLPNYVQQFPEVDGMWNSVYDAFFWVWMLFDMGTSVGFVKYFAGLRHKDPREALAMAQFFNWWQILTGALQVTVVGLLGAFIVPRTAYALYSHLIIVYALSQWPGIFFSFAYFFQAAQRYDYFQVLELLQNRVLFVAGPIPFILLGRYLGARSPVFGEALGAVLGTAAGFYFCYVVVLGISLLLYRRLRVGFLPMFLAGFNRRTAWTILSFGLRNTLGNVPHKVATFFEVALMTRLLLSYTEAIGIRGFLWYKFTYLFTFLWAWHQPAVATFSEAHTEGKLDLLRYYMARYLQYGHLYCALIFAFLLGVGPAFIRGALEPSWAAAAPLLLVACLHGPLLPSAWVVDAVQVGCGRPGTNAALMFFEQAVRLGLCYVLIPRYQVAGIFIALAVTLLLKAILGWTLVHTRIVRLRVPLWASIGAPFTAGLIQLLLWRGLLLLLGTGLSRAGLVVLVIAVAVATFPSGLWLLGWLGGFDAKALNELEGGAAMASGFQRVARVLHRVASHGARHALLRPRFPADLSEAAGRQSEPSAPA